MPDAEGHPETGEMHLQAVMSALSDPMRYRVVATLAGEPEGAEHTCTWFGLPVSKSTRTHHFRILREAGLICQVDRGNSRTVRLRRADLDARFPGLLDLIRKYPLD
ncbi:ArsR/SmtB family transcription factor [Nocardiopsis composta]|uniref:DNA-binding transcriptional ArsR family regulator n=1 Tax=Nocardiopsis composta TaxID=157465 RepID=A0A7W8QHX3_9ACTN|nr:helix-turn-helix transcriptional regulator [Nocardiopsis composta]MBB5430083.1 DNA-binding transcriptional ArsR family regulator [Nocardiopsis composta]